jgi:hypothetical protein
MFWCGSVKCSMPYKSDGVKVTVSFVGDGIKHRVRRIVLQHVQLESNTGRSWGI